MRQESSLAWLRKRQLEETSTQFRSSWELYLKFYTVFLTVNIAALGLTLQFVSGWISRLPIVLAFILQNANSLVTAVQIGKYSRKAGQRMSLLCQDIVAEGNERIVLPAHLVEPALPGELGYWGGIANAMGHGLMVLCWLFVLFIRVVAPSE